MEYANSLDPHTPCGLVGGQSPNAFGGYDYAKLMRKVQFLSDAEARRIKDFCRAGGTVVADYMPGLWDQHGKGRPGGGVLDSMFGIRHNPHMHARDVFGGRGLWCEIDQDANYGWNTYEHFMTNQNTCLRTEGFDKAVRTMPVGHGHRYGKGTAILRNLSPQWYNAYRIAGYQAARKRSTFLRPVLAACSPWVRLKHGARRTAMRSPTGTSMAARLFACASIPRSPAPPLAAGTPPDSRPARCR